MVRKSLPTRRLPERPSLNHLKHQARDLLAAFVEGHADAIAEVGRHYHDARAGTFALHDAQLVIARAYGFDSWTRLKAYVNGVTVRRLANAVQVGDFAGIRAMLHARPELANIDVAEDDEHRALHYAVLGRSPDMVRLLMQHGADARQGIWPNRDATSALTIAHERGYAEIVSIIQEEEARRTEPPRPDGVPPAGFSQEMIESILQSGDEARVIALFEATPRMMQFRYDLMTPLHAASAMLWTDVLVWLLDHGADVNARVDGGPSPLEIAGCGQWAKTPTPERIATVMSILRARGAELTPRAAVACGEAEWIRQRHAEGALDSLVLPPNQGNRGLLDIAVEHNRADMLELLLDLGLDPNERVRLDNLDEVVFSEGGPLHRCADTGNLAMAEILLAHGANPNAEVYASGSVLFRAYGRKDWKLVTLLERHGGLLDAASAGYLGQTDAAKQLLRDEAAGQLREGAVPAGSTLAETLLWSAAGGGDPEIVRLALHRIDWERGDPRWHWPLWQALTSDGGLTRGMECYRLLLERADPNVAKFGRTLLHDAIGSGKRVREADRLVFVKQLLDAGARTDLRDELLQATPLGWACRWGRMELVKLLLERGADPVEADAEPWAKPIALAEKMNHQGVAAVLRERLADAR